MCNGLQISEETGMDVVCGGTSSTGTRMCDRCVFVFATGGLSRSESACCVEEEKPPLAPSELLDGDGLVVSLVVVLHA